MDLTILDEPAFPIISIGLLALFFALVFARDVRLWKHGPHKCFKGHWEVAQERGKWIKSWICELHNRP